MASKFAMFFILSLTVLLSLTYSFSSFNFLNVRLKKYSTLLLASARPELDELTKEKIENLVQKNKVVLFMKGNKLFPQCGFSNTACRILDACSVNYETINVLEDDKIRNGIKVFSSWPTIPQLYVDGQFIGGSDIMVELYQSGELAEMLEISKAS